MLALNVCLPLMNLSLANKSWLLFKTEIWLGQYELGVYCMYYAYDTL